MDARHARTLDKFYTQPDAARVCLTRLSAVCAHLGWDPKETTWVEPSAGAGAFLQPGDAWPEPKGCDLHPEVQGVAKADFLTLDTARWSKTGRRPLVFVGNPPFGKKGALAQAFLNKALTEGKVVGFILPLLFRKWTTQKGIDASASLVADWDVPPDVFTFHGKPYAVRCCFQVWTRRPTPDLVDLRQRVAPIRSHPDFQMWQYNATPAAERYFDLDWDFGVLRQGYGDHNERVRCASLMSRRKQWVLFKASTPEVLARLESIDFNALAATNTSVGGFGKAEIVQHYKERFEGIQPRRQNEVFGCG
jgi:hypothetical protein